MPKSKRLFLLTSILIALFIYIWTKTVIQTEIAQVTVLDRFYALIAIIYFYIYLVINPLLDLFSRLTFKKTLIENKKIFLISAFIFAFLHTFFSFFGELDGFNGLPFLGSRYLLAISLSFTALILIIFILFKTRLLKAGTHIIIFLITVHALLLGSDFINISTFIPLVFFLALIILFGLEALTLDKYIKIHFKKLPRVGLSFFVYSIALVIIVVIFISKGQNINSPLNVHSEHILLAKNAQQTQQLPVKRFTVSFIHPDKVNINETTDLSFQVFDASSGNPVQIFSQIYTQKMHLVVIDSELDYFAHIHPEEVDGNFITKTQFPHPGQYHLYINFEPLGATEQQFAFTINVGQFDKINFSNTEIDTNLTKTFGKHQVSLRYPSPLKGSDLAIGNQKIKFTINSTTLKPYLGAFGHLVMINKDTFDYLHVHPTNTNAPSPDANGGPDVEFMPLGLYGPIKPGIYKLFAEFNPDNNLFIADFTVKIE
jgi:hypothetical protein